MIEVDDGVVYFARDNNIYHELFFNTYKTCALCKGDSFTGTKLCKNCRTITPSNFRFNCIHCGRKTTGDHLCYHCKEHPIKYNYGVSPICYVGGGKQIVQYFKTQDSYLKDFLADLIVAKLVGAPAFDTITSVPCDEIDMLDRGYNPSELLAKEVAKRLHRPYVRSMQKMFSTSEQKALSYNERVKNLKGAYKVISPEKVKGKKILLVDDIMTTGATANEITRILTHAGAKSVVLATIATAPDIDVELSEKDMFPIRSKFRKHLISKIDIDQE